MARPVGFEPTAYRLEGGCSDPLSYGRSLRDIDLIADRHFSRQWGAGIVCSSGAVLRGVPSHEVSMFNRRQRLRAVALLTAAALVSGNTGRAETAAPNGVVRVESAYPMAETIARLKQDIAAKGIIFFAEIDQAKLAQGAYIALRPSVLLIFGNPGLGSHFITAKDEAGLDWPVRLLVSQDEAGRVWAIYTDFAWIARRHGIATRDPQFAMASQVVASITSAVARR